MSPWVLLEWVTAVGLSIIVGVIVLAIIATGVNWLLAGTALRKTMKNQIAHLNNNKQ